MCSGGHCLFPGVLRHPTFGETDFNTPWCKPIFTRLRDINRHHEHMHYDLDRSYAREAHRLQNDEIRSLRQRTKPGRNSLSLSLSSRRNPCECESPSHQSVPARGERRMGKKGMSPDAHPSRWPNMQPISRYMMSCTLPYVTLLTTTAKLRLGIWMGHDQRHRRDNPLHLDPPSKTWVDSKVP